MCRGNTLDNGERRSCGPYSTPTPQRTATYRRECMRHLNKLGKGSRLLLAVAVGGAVFGIASAVQASIPDANGVIHGCYVKAGNPSQGALRVIDSAAACKPIENPLDWNQTGPTGPP